MEWNQLIWYFIATAVGVGAGYTLGTRSGRKMKRRVVQQMNVQALDLLDARSEITQLAGYAAKQKRKDKLLKLTLTKLQQANKAVAASKAELETANKKHFVAISRMRMHALEARETARKAAAIARKATLHLRRLEKSSPITQTIEAPEPKSYGKSDSVTVSVVDQAHLDGSAESMAQVSNRDSARLSKLHSSNEATAG
ncbi:MAG: hypothetical protein AB8B64_16805 [Granulosicoccus sp.]